MALSRQSPACIMMFFYGISGALSGTGRYYNMKYFIASDIHGSAYYCRRLLEAYQREGTDRFVLLGDILYHGPRNDLPKDYNPKEVFAMLNDIKDSILCVRGNCDSEVDQMVLEFPIMAPYAILTQGNLVVYATHGDHYNTHRLPPLQKGDILLHGHTHLPVWEPFGQDNYYLNPGSASLPKDGNPHSYLVWEDQTFTWKDMDGKAFHELTL